jgi:hypothetical protein
MKFTWTNFKKVKAARTVGSLLKVDLPLLGIEALTAKVDTGAFNGALHASDIREVKDKQGNKRLRFSPMGSHDHTIEIDSYHKRRIKSSNGLASSRYTIDTEVTIAGHTYPITLTLTNRSFMKRQMLVGRNFLRLHGFLVDVNRGKQ